MKRASILVSLTVAVVVAILGCGKSESQRNAEDFNKAHSKAAWESQRERHEQIAPPEPKRTKSEK